MRFCHSLQPVNWLWCFYTSVFIKLRLKKTAVRLVGGWLQERVARVTGAYRGLHTANKTAFTLGLGRSQRHIIPNLKSVKGPYPSVWHSPKKPESWFNGERQIYRKPSSRLLCERAADEVHAMRNLCLTLMPPQGMQGHRYHRSWSVMERCSLTESQSLCFSFWRDSPPRQPLQL